jgi:hypothetical protein
MRRNRSWELHGTYIFTQKGTVFVGMPSFIVRAGSRSFKRLSVTSWHWFHCFVGITSDPSARKHDESLYRRAEYCNLVPVHNHHTMGRYGEVKARSHALSIQWPLGRTPGEFRKRKISALAENRIPTPLCPSRSQVTIPNELSRPIFKTIGSEIDKNNSTGSPRAFKVALQIYSSRTNL